MSFTSFSRRSNSEINVEGYDIIGEIGRGSYAVVYKAIDTATQEPVAIKCIERTKLSQSGKDNVVMEIKLMKMLRHDFIVHMKNFLWDDRYIYIILEFCDGGDLSQFIYKRQKIPEKIIKKFMQHLALGLQYLRSKNICHWDLKPQNLLLVTQPTLSLKIGDFGLAGCLSDETMKMSLRGSPLYMAPEVLLSYGFDSRADLWSVGIILYECLFGRAPLANSTSKQILLDIKNRVPIEIPRDKISPLCLDLLQRLLVYDKGKRITYDDFFSHPFLDLEHFPGEESYIKAVKLAREAVKLDNLKEYVSAFNMYCQALNYLIPFTLTEEDIAKKMRIRMKIAEYTKRAEVLKVLLYKSRDAFVTQPDVPVDFEPEVKSTTSKDSQTSLKFGPKELKNICLKTPKLLDAVDIGYAAQMYLFEGKYEVAADRFRACLSMVSPLMEQEPEGLRKKMLTKQVAEWSKQAESANTLLKTRQQDYFETQPDQCVIQ